MTRCTLCPVDQSIACRGIVVRRFCELIDQSNPAYHPGAVQSVQLASENASRIDSNASMTMDDADRLIAQAEVAMMAYDPRKGSCCG